MSGQTLALAGFVARSGAADLPAEVVHQAKRCLVDYLGVTLGGQAHDSVGLLLEYVRQVGSVPQATVLGRGMRTSMPFAAMINGQSAHVLDFDDTLMSGDTSLHGTCQVYSAALASGEWTHATGASVLNAFVAGFEVAARVAHALGPAHYDAGWHVTGTAGRLGAAAAAAKLLGLDTAGIATSLGIAGTQAAGNKAAYGTMGKGFHAGRAAHDGVAAAMLARLGFTAPHDVLEAEHGVLHLYSRDPRPEALWPLANGRYTVLDDGFKPYPCGSLTHAAIDAAVEIFEQHHPDHREIDRIEARVNPYTASVTGKAAPQTELESKFSAQHCIAVALKYGRPPGLEAFETRTLMDPDVVGLRDRVHLIGDAACEKASATVTVYLKNGRAPRTHVPHAKGTTARPLDDEALAGKFLSLAEPVCGGRAFHLLELAWRVDELEDIATLIEKSKSD
jgi:2-methylcitrate dehydratase PrpD